MPEKIPQSKEVIKSPTVMELAFRKAEETKEEEESARGENLGTDIWDTLSDPNILQNLTLEKAKIAATKTKEILIQVETKSGLATGWQPEVAPQGRVMPQYVPSDTGPLIQVETKPQVDFKETLASEDHTPKEWRDTLRGFIERVKENFGIRKRFAGMKEYLANRLKELDTQVK